MQVLQRLAELQMNIIMVIHQPRYEIFECFDTVLLLGTGGPHEQGGAREGGTAKQ